MRLAWKARQGSRLRTASAVLGLCFVAACGGGGGGGGFLPWPQFRHDATNTGRGEALIAASTGHLVWNLDVGSPVTSTPAVDGTGTVYVATNATPLQVIDPAGAAVCSLEPGLTSSHSSPLLSNDTLFVGSDFGPIYMVNASCALSIFFQTGGALVASPNTSGNFVFVGSSNGTFFALDRGTLATKWTFGAGGPIRSSAAIASDGSVRFGSDDGNLYAVSSAGKELWHTALGGPVQSSPAIGSDGTTYVGSNAGTLSAVGPDGALLWAAHLGGAVESSPAIGVDGTIYVGSDDKAVHALNSGGAEIWRFATNGAVKSSPAVSSDGIIVIGSNDGSVYALDQAGHLRWKFATGGAITGSPALGPAGLVVVGSGNGHVYELS